MNEAKPYVRKVNKELIPTCNIMGVEIAAVSMEWLLRFTRDHITELSGDYMCVSNVHTTVTAYKNPSYMKVQNSGIMAIPDGGPLSSIGRKAGYKGMERITGPSYMEEILKISERYGWRHFFYGSTDETLEKLYRKLVHDYPEIQISGMYSPPFRDLTQDEDMSIIQLINESNADFVWVGLGAPKQEQWMYCHQGQIKGFMVGVGAGFDYFAGNIQRAPEWMQRNNLEWVYRLLQDPKRLIKRYVSTNSRFLIWTATHKIEGPQKQCQGSGGDAIQGDIQIYSHTVMDNTVQVESSKKRVLIVHNYYKTPGGEDTVVANERRLLEKNGHFVILYTRHNNEIDQMSKIEKMFKLSVTTFFNPKTYMEIRKIIKEMKIDIVHVHNTLNLVSPAVYYAAVDCKIPVVQTVHNFRLLCPGAIFYRDGHICEACMKKGLKCAVKYGCYRGSKIESLACVMSLKYHRKRKIYSKINYICLTEFNRSKLIFLKQIRENRIFIKPNFVEGLDHIVSPDQRRNQYVFAGRLDKLKGIDILLKAWKRFQLNAPKLLICGTGPMREWCEQYISENGLMTVKMLGFVSNDEVRKLIADSKALILPTQLYEGFPMSIVEAFSVGTPVVCSDLGNAGSVVEEGVTGTKFKADSIEGLIEAMERLSYYKDIYNTTYSTYKERYSETKNYERLIEIYHAVCD